MLKKDKLFELLSKRKVYEGYTVDQDGTSVMDDGFNFIEHSNGCTLQFFVADTSIYYEETDTIPNQRRSTSLSPNLGDESETLKPRTFSLCEHHQSPAVGIFVKFDQENNIVSTHIERVLFFNKKAYSFSGFKETLMNGDSTLRFWVEKMKAIQQKYEKDSLARVLYKFNFVTVLSNISNYAFTLFCVKNKIPIIYQNTDLRSNSPLLDPVNHNKIKYHQYIASSQIDDMEYSLLPKRNFKNGYAPFARFSSPIRFCCDTINLWLITEFLKTNNVQKYNLATIEKVANDQTLLHKDNLSKNTRDRINKLQDEIITIMRSPHIKEALANFPTKKLSFLTSYLFSLDHKELSKLIETVSPYNNVSHNHFMHPFMEHIFEYAYKNNDLNLLTRLTLENPRRNKVEKLFAFKSRNLLLNQIDQSYDSILTLITNHQSIIDLDEIFFTKHETHEDIAFKPVIVIGKESFSIPIIPSLKKIAPSEAIVLAKKALLRDLLKRNLVLSTRSVFDWEHKDKKNMHHKKLSL